jgi:hypothetical protein
MLPFALAECDADREPTVAKLYGEELHKIKLFEAVGSKINNTDLPVVRGTARQHFSSSVDVGGEEGVGSGAILCVLDAENAASVCPERLGKQSNCIRNDDENDSIAAALSNVLLKPSHMTSIPVS